MVTIIKIACAIVFLIIFSQVLYSQPLRINWQQCYGGSNYECGYKIVQKSNGFFLFCGTNSNDGNVFGNHGASDYWLINTDSSGNILSGRTYGGIGDEESYDMKPTFDGGFILFGTTFTMATSGEVVGNHGGSDFWLVKIDSLENIEWSKCLCGSCGEQAYKLDIKQDGGYICIGYSCSQDGNVTANHGNYDIWAVSLDPFGNILWEKSFGGTFTDWGLCVQSTSDGGAIIGGLIGSSNGNILCNYRNFDDCWVAKLDSAGDIEWQNCFGGTGNESVVSIIPTDDGGYLFTGSTNSNDGDVSGNHGDYDIWVVRLDHWGNLVWQKCYGGSHEESAQIIIKCSDGNYFIGGYTFSNDGQVSGNHSLAPNYCDIWLIKISSAGNLIWQQCFGGEASEGIEDLLEMPGGRLMLLGGTETSNNSGNVQCAHQGTGTNDVWLLSVSDTTYIGLNEMGREPFKIWIYPNPADNNIIFNFPESDCNSNTSVRIANIYGQIVDSFILYRGESKKNLECNSFPSGLYFYTYSNDHFNGNGTIIVMH